MTTLATGTPSPETRKVGSRTYREILPPTIFKFKEVGEVLGGYLRGINPVHIGDDDTFEYIIEQDSGQIVKLRQSADLAQKVTRAIIGKHIIIEYTGEADTGKDSKMKVYKVMAEEGGPRRVLPATEITDDDLPANF
jgi:hypothetical protein